MSTTLEDVLYDDYLADQARQEMEAGAIEEFTEDILKRYFQRNPYLLKVAKEANGEAIALYKEQHFTASLVFSFTAIELLTKEVIIKPLIHGNIIDESIADYITADIVGKMKNYSQYSRMLSKFMMTYGKIDIKNYKESNLVSDLEKLQKLRNDALHNGRKLTPDQALFANKISKLFYDAVVETMDVMNLVVDRKEWKILPK